MKKKNEDTVEFKDGTKMKVSKDSKATIIARLEQDKIEAEKKKGKF